MDEAAIISSAEEQLKNFGSFLFDHYNELTKLLDNVKTENVINSSLAPVVEIDYSCANEQLSLLRLLESERVLNKTLLTFAHLCKEFDVIAIDAKHMQLKLLCIDDDLCAVGDNNGNNNIDNITVDSTQQKNEKVLLKMSQHIEFLYRVHFLLQRCIVLGNNLLQQCGTFLAYRDSGSGDAFNLELKLFDVFDTLGNVVMQILIFDEILAGSNFLRFWPTYKKTLEAIVHNPNMKNECAVAEMNGLQNSLYELDFLFTGALFKGFLDSTFSLKDRIGPKGLGQLTQQANDYVRQNLANIDKFESPDLNDLHQPQQLIRLNCLCVVFHDFCGQIESKLVKHLIELNVKHQGIILVGNILWSPMPFLRKHSATLINQHEKLLQDVQKQRKAYLQARLQNLERDVQNYGKQFVLWSLNMERSLVVGIYELKVEQLKNLTALFLLGLRYAGRMRFIAKSIINLHVALQMPMTKSTLMSVCTLIDLIVAIKSEFQKKNREIARVIYCILQYLQYKVLFILENWKKRFSTTKLHDRNVDTLAAIWIAEKCLAGPPSRNRLLIANLAINSTIISNRNIPQEQHEKFWGIMQRIEILSNYQKNYRDVCDTTFIYWHQAMLEVHLKQLVQRKMNYNIIQYFLEAADSCHKTMISHGLTDLQMTQQLKSTIYNSLRNIVINDLCAKIETYLRLEVHSHLQPDRKKTYDEKDIIDYRDMIEVYPIEINGKYVIIKDHIENYLSTMFYNLTAISLHDWRTYVEMRYWAKENLGCATIEDYLPNQTLEQGIDLLEIMRNIHIFVNKYAYDMQTHTFLELHSPNKYLESFGITQVANSLRTHGSGVINTTVNFTYQFLRQKFYTFSQFLYDEQIKSRLMKESRVFAQRKESKESPLYPFERAEEFNRDIRRLGLNADGQTYMDLFRKLITHIGNAMCYIRLIRAGNMEASYEAAQYLPNFNEEPKLIERFKELELSETAVKAAENAEIVIKNVIKNFTDSTNYFKLLVDAFQPFIKNSQNAHLKYFYLIVPALTVNYVEHMLAGKAKINNKSQEGALLFDDGFIVGLGYILTCLDQFIDFNSLEWFPTVRERFKAERIKMNEMLKDINSTTAETKIFNFYGAAQKEENERLRQTLALTEQRIQLHEKEYDLLYWSLWGAKVFFM